MSFTGRRPGGHAARAYDAAPGVVPIPVAGAHSGGGVTGASRDLDGSTQPAVLVDAVPSTGSSPSLVAVVSTGGTISSRTDPSAGRRPTLGGQHLVEAAQKPSGVQVRVVEVRSMSSFAMTPADMGAVLAAVAEQLKDPVVSGVVVTHGTDTLEETAYLAQLFHADPRPVVLTGAIRPADDAEPDGSTNLRDALIVASAATARHRGVLVVFDGQIFAAAATLKVDTGALAAFASPDFGPVGAVGPGGARFTGPPPAWSGNGLTGPVGDLAGVRVDVAALYPGADCRALDAFAAAGARGIVLEGTGSGNAPPGLTACITELSDAGVVIALTTRVHRGQVLPLYGGGGGGRELVAAGAIAAGWVRSSQTRIALLALLATQPNLDQARQSLTAWTSDPIHTGNAALGPA